MPPDTKFCQKLGKYFWKWNQCLAWLMLHHHACTAWALQCAFNQ